MYYDIIIRRPLWRVTLDSKPTLYDACEKALELRRIIPEDRGEIRITIHGCALITVTRKDKNIGDILSRAEEDLVAMVLK